MHLGVERPGGRHRTEGLPQAVTGQGWAVTTSIEPRAIGQRPPGHPVHRVHGKPDRGGHDDGRGRQRNRGDPVVGGQHRRERRPGGDPRVEQDGDQRTGGCAVLGPGATHDLGLGQGGKGTRGDAPQQHGQEHDERVPLAPLAARRGWRRSRRPRRPERGGSVAHPAGDRDADRGGDAEAQQHRAGPAGEARRPGPAR